MANIMRLSLKKGAHAAVSSAAWQEIRVRSGRDDKSVEPFTPSRPLGTQSIFLPQICQVQQPLSMEAPPSPFVISTEAQRSGEISVLTPLPGNVFRLERSAVERSAVSFHFLMGTSGGGGKFRFLSHSLLMLCGACCGWSSSRSGMKISRPACGVIRV